MKNKNIGLLGATGYTGYELLKMIASHPDMNLSFASSGKSVGVRLGDYFPMLPPGEIADMKFCSPEEATQIEVDGVFSCLPHATAAEQLLPFIGKENSPVLVDLSADFRMRDADIYEEYYHKHPAPELLEKAVYGLCEVYGDDVKKSKLIGNPGCYPTSILLPLMPLLKAGLLEAKGIIADSKSGTSGAGKSPGAGTHFVEVHDNFSAYKPGDEHRHLSEINEQLSFAAGEKVNAIFTPHLLPIARGILSTVYAKVKPGVSTDQIQAELDKAYVDSEFVHVMDQLPKTSWVKNTNSCRFGFKLLNDGETIVIVSVIDNLLKGASGQAMQNMNMAMGLDTKSGLLV